ncbi:MAG: response regulator [Balneolaceae bacterium]|nr:response regulator [Balneolaceae bacterium]
MKKLLRILHLEDDKNDFRLVQMALDQWKLNHDIQLASTQEEFLSTLSNNEFDLILSDSSIPGFSGRAALEAARERFPKIPFIFVSGHIVDESERDVEAEYVSKEELGKLKSTIKRLMEDAGIKTEARKDSDSSTKQLIDAVQQLSLARDLQAVMKIVRRVARELTGADGATFVLRERGLCYYADEDAIAPLWKGKRFPMSACISGWVMNNSESAIIEDIYSDSRIPADAYRPTFVKSLAMVPIRSKNPVGAIGNYWASKHKATSEEVEMLQTLANSTAIAMENVHLYNELECRVEERTQQLKAANEELEAFSYSVSHDLRTPLRHIKAYSQLLKEDSADQLGDTGNDYLQHIRESASRMGQLIEDLLKLSKITRTEIVKEQVNLTQMVNEIASSLREEDDFTDRQVTFAIEEEVEVEGDPSLLRVVIENLFSNAWKYSSEEPETKISFGCNQETGEPDIYYIKDNGAGFDMEYADKLFSPFQRLHAESEFSGTGIGLATVQRIIHKHGGRIWAEAAKGKGATFFFTLSAKSSEKNATE